MSEPKPAHLTAENAEAFTLPSVVDSYGLRPPYPERLWPLLVDRADPPEGPVLDLGTGTGEIARALAPHVGRVDAIDPSAAMLARARTLPGGDAENIRWIEGRVEDVDLDGPYVLAVAGSSFGWFDWDVTVTRLQEALEPGAPLALITQQITVPWQAELDSVISRYSVMPDYEPFNLAELLEERELFEAYEEITLERRPMTQSVEDYVASFHSMASFPRERMGDTQANEFDRVMSEMLERHTVGGALRFEVGAELVCGDVTELDL